MITAVRTPHRPTAVALARPMEYAVPAGTQDATVRRLGKAHLADADRTEWPAGCVLGELVSFTIVRVPELLAAVDVPREDQTMWVMFIARRELQSCARRGPNGPTSVPSRGARHRRSTASDRRRAVDGTILRDGKAPRLGPCIA